MTAPAPGRRGFLGGAAALLLASGATGAAVPGVARAGENTGGGRAFTHPGLLHSAADLARMRAAVAAGESPVHDGYLALAASPRSSSAYTVQNTGQITSWGRGPANFANQAVADSAAAYQNALMWCVTGDRAHADKARDILDAWSASLTAITGADGPLGAGLQAFKFVNAAELLRHSGYDGWAPADIARCEESFLRVWYPAVSGYMLYANGNWDLTALQTILAIGVFCEEPTLFDDALRFAAAGAGNGSVGHRIVTDAGQGQESGRDQGHEQLAVGLLGDAAQVAWNQGVDLWGFDGNRILANVEYAARYNLGGDVPFSPDLDRTGKYLKTSVSDNFARCPATGLRDGVRALRGRTRPRHPAHEERRSSAAPAVPAPSRAATTTCRAGAPRLRRGEGPRPPRRRHPPGSPRPAPDRRHRGLAAVRVGDRLHGPARHRPRRAVRADRLRGRDADVHGPCTSRAGPDVLLHGRRLQLPWNER
jgi:hypothetical protein